MLGRLRRFFQFRNSPPPQPANEAIDAPIVRRHSPTEIAILRCSDVIFFETNEEIAREKLQSRLEEEGAKEIGVIRRLPDAEVAGYYDELLPLLCIYFPTKNDPDPESTENIRKRGMTIRVDAIDGKVYQMEMFPARKHHGSRSSVGRQNLESTTSVVCGWKLTLQGNTRAEYKERLAKHEEPGVSVDLLNTNRSIFFDPTLKDLASFAVAHQVGGNVEGLSGIIPSTLVAYLKGQ